MSGAARRRGQARGRAQEASDASSHRQGASRGRGVPQLDGPASQGPGSAQGSQMSRASNAPGAPAASQGGFTPQGSQAHSRSTSVSQTPAAGAQVVPPKARQDPALDKDKKPELFTDNLRNVDLPASFYNINGEVSPLHYCPLILSHHAQPGKKNMRAKKLMTGLSLAWKKV